MDSRSDRAFFGHPRAVGYFAGTEFWERVSFHGMLALLTLFMVGHLLQPEHLARVWGFAGYRAAVQALTGTLSPSALATQTVGLYVGLVYFTPVFGGLLGDRVLGRTASVTLGGLLMAAGHFCMAFDATFLVALLLLVLGSGLLRGNLLAQLGQVYPLDDPRRDEGFQIYYGAVNVAFFVAPLITGFLAQEVAWHAGFGFAGLGMLAGLGIYLSGRRHFPPEIPRARREHARLSRRDWRVIGTLLALVPALTMFWVAETQLWNTYNLWARDHVALRLGGWNIPVPWLQSVDGFAAFSMVPPLLAYWRWQRRRGAEPDDIGKIARGCFVFGLAMAWLAAGGLVAGPGHKVPLAWDFVSHFINAVGYLGVQPVATALFARAAPAAVNAAMVGVYLSSIFLGSVISGRLGGLYEAISPASFWLIHAAIAGTGGVIILAFARKLRRVLEPV